MNQYYNVYYCYHVTIAEINFFHSEEGILKNDFLWYQIC